LPQKLIFSSLSNEITEEKIYFLSKKKEEEKTLPHDTPLYYFTVKLQICCNGTMQFVHETIRNLDDEVVIQLCVHHESR